MADRILAAAIESGDGAELPFIESRPALEPHLRFEMQAFWDLIRDRSMGFSIGPLTWSSVRSYAEAYGIVDIDEFERLKTLMFALDDEYLDHVERQREKDKSHGNA